MYKIESSFAVGVRTIAFCLVILAIQLSSSCSLFHGHEHDEAGGHGNQTTAAKRSTEQDNEHGEAGEHKEEAIARTEFSDRLLNFFEFAPLHKGKTSQFLFHLTDLTDGTPVANADVTLLLRKPDGQTVGEVKAKVGRVTGIYVADVQFAEIGNYDIQFYIKNDKLDERMPLKDFKVE